MPIEKLPLLLINQIAAGEVIERPASVVKELVENSLDAGSTRIDIAIEEGGRRLIRVADNGSGIEAGQLVLAVSPHATSKLARPQQLASIATLGFRGEALASIASVSRLRVTSRATVDGQTADAGAVIEASGDHISQPVPAACAPGTSVEIRDLFFNTPARRKFLRSASTEFGHIADTVTRTAMFRPDVGFKLTHNARVVIDLPPSQTRRQRCVELIGKELDEVLLEFDLTQPLASLRHETGVPPSVTSDAEDVGRVELKVWGLAGKPVTARSTSKYQYLCVNGRPVKDRTLSHAVKEAYRGLMPPDQQPTAVVCLDVPPQSVDVNVHPTKAEVRFQDPNRLHGLVLTAMRQRLLGSDLTPSATMTNERFKSQSSFDPMKIEVKSPFASDGAGTSRALDPSAPTDPTDVSAAPNAFVDYFKRMDPKQKGFVYEQVKQAMVEEVDQPLLEQTEAGDPLSDRHGEPPRPATEPSVASRVLQVHNSYLVTEDAEGLVIVDQHALHERVMFEQLRRRVLAGPLESQRLLTPAVVKADPARIALLESLTPLLTRIGIEAEPFGAEAVAVHAFPSFLFDRRVEPDEFLAELLDQAQEGQLVTPAVQGQGQDLEEAVLHQVLDIMSCKAAVKAGDHLAPGELDSLLAQRDQIERSSSCPHGRPTSYRITLKQLAKEFKRT